MAYIELPIESGPSVTNFDVSYTLDGKDYEFRFRYNGRGDYWSMSLFDAEGNSLREGKRVVVNFPVNLRTVLPNGPPGLLFVFDPRAVEFAPNIDELGSTVILAYKETI